MKRILSAVLAIVVMVVAFPMSAVAETDGYYTYTVTDGKVTITDVDTSISGEVTIPSELGGYPVTSIGSSAFYWCRSLTSVVIPDSVTSIGDGAFSSCESLTSVTIPGSVTSIGDMAFYGCSSLTSVVIPDSVTSIGDGAFEFCGSIINIEVSENNTAYKTINGVLFTIDEKTLLKHPSGNTVTEYVIPEGVMNIDKGAFYGCTSLTSVTIPASVKEIGVYAFYKCDTIANVYISDLSAWCNIDFYDGSAGTLYCYSNPLTYADNLYLNGELMTELVIPDGVTNISVFAFYGFDGITSVTIPDSVTYIGMRAFCDCDGLTSVVIPDSVTSIDDYAFYDCDGLTSITIGSGVKSMTTSSSYASYAFANCDNLTDVTIKQGAKVIGSYAFSNCSALTSVTIPVSVTTIGYKPFSGCSNVTIYGLKNSTAHTYATNNNIPFGCAHLDTIIVGAHDPGCTADGYAGDTLCLDCGEIITSGEIIPSNGSHTWDDGVVTVEPGNTTEGAKSFTCTVCGETKIEILKAIFIIEDSVLISYTGDGGDVIIPEGVTAIGAYAFALNNNITSVSIPSGVTVVGEGAFVFCKNLKTVTLPTTLKTIEKGAFAFCESIEEIEIPKSVTEIGTGAFNCCTSLGETFISDKVVKIGEDVFDGCEELTLRFYDTAPMAAYAEENGLNYLLVLCGDADDNGVVNAADITLINRKLAGADIELELGADVNRTGRVNASDITMLRRLISGATE